jgi:diguanylate cyclase (GGDEF)-like protein
MKREKSTRLIVFAIIYAVLLVLGLNVLSSAGKTAVIWPAGGFLLGFLVISEISSWSSLLIIVFALSVLIEGVMLQRSLTLTTSFFIINAIEATLGALVVRRFCGGKIGFLTLKQVLFFLLFVVLGIPAVTATFASGAIIFFTEAVNFSQIYLSWFSSAALGILFVVPCVITLAQSRKKLNTLTQVQWLELVAIWLIAFFLGFMEFEELDQSVHFVVQPYTLFPVLIWSAVRFELLGTTSSGVVWVIVVAWRSTLTGHSIGLASSQLVSNKLALQILCLIIALSSLSFAVALRSTKEALIRKQQAENEALQSSELTQIALARYQRLFETSEVCLLEEDFSEVFRKLEELKQKGVTNLKQYISQNPQLPWLLASLVRVVKVNQATLNLFCAGNPSEYLDNIGATFGSDAIHVFSNELYAMWNKEDVFRAEANYKTLEGQELTALISMPIPQTVEQSFSVPVTILDITAIKESEAKIRYLAHHDPLTNLPNRLLLKNRLDQSIQNAIYNNKKLAVVFIDIDRFKQINDSLGHTAGDRVLQELATRLTQQLRCCDTVARLSGDEFIVVLEDVDTFQNTTAVIENLMRSFETPFSLEHHEIYITCTMGISLFPDHGQAGATLLRNADTAMYQAKDEGRNNYRFYTEEMTVFTFEQMMMESSLKVALKKQEFYLVYQPQIDLHSQCWTGMEVLLRWEHSQLGGISPGKFIPLAEKTGIIKEIGAWVLKNSCLQAKLWLDQGLNFGRIAVNIAIPQLNDKNFVQIIQNTLRDTGLPPQYLELELTEGCILDQTTEQIQQLEELRAMNIQIAIDDFGTGYSSLSYLKQLPIDILKIDQSFVRDLPHDANDMAISKAIIALGQALDLKILAEGVETEEQAAFLRENGCHEAQGYLYSKPISPELIEKLFR